MKILILLPNNSVGGAEQYLKMIATFYQNDEVTIVYFKKNNRTQWDDMIGLVTQRYMSPKHEVLGVIKYVLSLFTDRTKYDYVFTSHVFTNALCGLLISLRLLRVRKFIARESTTIFLRFEGLLLFIYKMCYRIGYRNISLLICQTQLMKDQLLEHFPRIAKRTNVEVVPNPINLHEIEIKSKEAISTDLPDEYIVTAGRLIHEKGYDILINVFAKLKTSHPNLKLIILGRGDLKEVIDQQVADLNLTEDVIFPGYVSNVYAYFKSAKVCVVSSRIEGFPNVLLQMMTQNTNVVSTTCAGGIDEIPNITTAKPNDEESLFEAIQIGLSKTNTENNRSSFDAYLAGRDIHTFLKRVTRV